MNAPSPDLVTDVVALYVDPRGPYPGIVADWYDEARDARTYAGPWPVVAHPPCGPWGQFKHLSKHQDPTLAPIAVGQVREFGGVLEHPRFSTLWKHCALPLPDGLPDAFGGISIEVEQLAWGHACIKPTWLYVVGVRRRELEAGRRFRSGPPTHRMTNGPRGVSKRGDLIRASAEIRRRTPPAFARWLVELARGARRP